MTTAFQLVRSKSSLARASGALHMQVMALSGVLQIVSTGLLVGVLGNVDLLLKAMPGMMHGASTQRHCTITQHICLIDIVTP